MNDADLEDCAVARTPSSSSTDARRPPPSWASRRSWSRAGGVSTTRTPSVLNPATDELRMLNRASSGRPDSFAYEAEGRRWYGAAARGTRSGSATALHADGRIETSCPDCGEPIALEIRDGRPDDESLLFHVLVPAHHWWDDIVFT